MRYVYILKAGSDHYKVGIAKSVTKRLQTIQTGNAYKIYLVASRICNNAELVERRLHEKLVGMSTDGGSEWFKLKPEDVLRVCILLNTEPELDVYENTAVNQELSDQGKTLKLIHDELSSFIKVLAQSSSTAQVQVNNTLDLSKASPKIDRDQQRKQAEEVMYLKALRTVIDCNKASTSLLQRRLGIGYGRAARLMEELELNQVVSGPAGVHARTIIYKPVVAARAYRAGTTDSGTNRSDLVRAASER